MKMNVIKTILYNIIYLFTKIPNLTIYTFILYTYDALWF